MSHPHIFPSYDVFHILHDHQQYDYPESDFYETSDAKEILQSLASANQLQPLALDPSDCLPPFEVIVNPSHLQSVVGGSKNYNDYIDGKFVRNLNCIVSIRALQTIRTRIRSRVALLGA